MADFTDRLRGVWSLILTPPDEVGLRRPYTVDEVVEVLDRRYDEHAEDRTVSKARLKQLRTLPDSNPSVDVLRTIAGAFAELALRTLPEDTNHGTDHAAATEAIVDCLVHDHTIRRGLAARVIDDARSRLGKPFNSTASGPDSYSDAGLIHDLYYGVRVLLPLTAIEQAGAGEHVPLALAEAGDLMFWSRNGQVSGIHHVAVYLGEHRIIEAVEDEGVRERDVVFPAGSRPGEAGLLGIVTRTNRADSILNQFMDLARERDRSSEIVGVMGRYMELETPEARRAVIAFIEAERRRETMLDRASNPTGTRRRPRRPKPLRLSE
jgi:cell wall-associated NlpC family hydrolase